MSDQDTQSARLAARINKRLEVLNRSAITAALNVGLERTYLRDFLIGRKRSLGSAKLDQVAKALDWTVTELTDFDAPVVTEGPTRLRVRHSTHPTLDSITEDIPVVGITMGGSRGTGEHEPDFWLNGEVINWVARPQGIKNAANVFALYVSGDSMYPRFRERDLVFVQDTSPSSGDDVVIELKATLEGEPSPSFIKEFVKRKGSYVLVKQYNPVAEIEFSVEEIRNIFRVLPLKELVG